jgi:hypothetical protein
MDLIPSMTHQKKQELLGGNGEGANLSFFAILSSSADVRRSLEMAQSAVVSNSLDFHALLRSLVAFLLISVTWL